MSEHQSITVSRAIDAPMAAVFDALTTPARHKDFDGSGMVVAAVDPEQRITEVGDVFTMDMHHESQGGDYQMDNHVVTFDSGSVVGWAPCPAGKRPFGWTFTYTLVPQEDARTHVTLTYDWSQVTHPKILPMLPAMREPELSRSLDLLATVLNA